MLASVFVLLAGCASGVPRSDLPPTPAETETAHRIQVRLELASAYFARGQYSTALDEVKAVLALKPDSSAALGMRGLIAAAQGDNAQAEQSFRRAQAADPTDGDVNQNFGWFLCQIGRYPEAQAEFGRALATKGYRGRSRTLMNMGICLARSGDLEGGEAQLMRSYELDPSNPVTAINLSEVLLRRGDLTRARFYIRRVVVIPDFASAQSLWLAARIEHGLHDQAGEREYGDQLHNRFPNSPEALLFDRGKFDE